jgi:hypothetical protein
MCLAEISIQSIRKYFPNSEVILSTHQGSDVSHLDYDKLALTEKDIFKLVENDKFGNFMNANNQLRTTQAGLELATRPYLVKIRTDMFFENTKILTLLNNRPSRVNSHRVITREPVIVLNWSTVNPDAFLKLLHHPSDQLYAGTTDDIRSIWSCPSYPTSYMRWFETHPYPKDAQHGDYLQRYRAESWIWYNYVKEYCSFDFPDSYTFSQEQKNESKMLMVSNLMVVSNKMAGVSSSKNGNPSWRSQVKMLSYFDWLQFAKTQGVRMPKFFFDAASVKVFLIRIFIKLLRRQRLVFPQNKYR